MIFETVSKALTNALMMYHDLGKNQICYKIVSIQLVVPVIKVIDLNMTHFFFPSRKDRGRCSWFILDTKPHCFPTIQ
jgi:hypothetical protein